MKIQLVNRLVPFFFGFLPAVSAFGQEPPADKPAIDVKAEEVFRHSSDFLGKLPQFRFEAEILLDQTDAAGQKLQYSNLAEAKIIRPNRVCGASAGDTANKRYWYDGKRVAILDEAKRAYSVVEAPPTIDAMLDQMADQYGLTLPIADLLLSDMYAGMMEDVTQGRYIGLHRVGPYRCHHLAFSQPNIDWQIWIEEGDRPFPRRLTITHKQMPAQPQYTATFTKWETDVKLDEKQFVFEPPFGATRIEMLPTKGATGIGENKGNEKK